jgi:threonine dehydrogenase-like Zn-dependent dehydrogenase
MQTLIVTAPGELEWREVPDPPSPAAAAALVRPTVTAVCDFDHLIVAGNAPVPYPFAIGHEMVGEVVETGSEVCTVSAGDDVIVPFQISCGSCGPCTKGLTSCCAAVPWLSSYGLGDASGGWGAATSDLVTVPYADAMLIKLPESIPAPLAAVTSCNVTDAYRCVAPQLASEPGAPVLVAAGGFQNIAFIATVLAITLGSEQVDVVGLRAPLAAKAQALGARIINSVADVENATYPIAADCSLDPTMLAAALSGTAPGGTCTITSVYPAGLVPVPLLDLFAACATINVGQPHVRGLLPDVLELLEQRTGLADVLIDQEHDWDHAIEAFTGAGKHVVVRT